mmetsp:Transcript_11946/g.27924  ORF Transcript_11946/g.27924 Transcript_11946/m.27924 type:complete len:85 (+) Transcript_11946:1385-1639(+)
MMVAHGPVATAVALAKDLAEMLGLSPLPTPYPSGPERGNSDLSSGDAGALATAEREGRPTTLVHQILSLQPLLPANCSGEAAAK